LGWWGFIGLIIVAAGLIAWWGWEQARQLPLPPQAQNVSSEILGALARKTTFVVPAPSAEVRAFYRETLPQRGWAYCGTQATPGCTNLIPAADGSGDQVDVFRRADDQDASGTTIEIWLAENPRGGTVVSILEANPSR
ncbi:MAG TPA: hypothetical protein GYA10_08535, partial [Alphaproteobacteria bacterium]|nr:hypothetical protein [Alphaproteobacteria bacterium]